MLHQIRLELTLQDEDEDEDEEEEEGNRVVCKGGAALARVCGLLGVLAAFGAPHGTPELTRSHQKLSLPSTHIDPMALIL